MIALRKCRDMIDWIRTLLKSITGELNAPKAIWKLCYTTIGCISSLFSLAVLLKDLMGCDKLEIWVKENWIIAIIASLIISCLHNRKKMTFYKNASNVDMRIEIRVRDIFWNRVATSYVIPTNTFFRTEMRDEYISPNSVQGRFQLKYFKEDLPSLDSQICENLISQGIEGNLTSDRFGSTKKYPIGTVAKIDHKGNHFYFIAINDVNESGKPINQSIENVNTALVSLTKAIKEFGHCDILCIPLLGSGKAAIQEATKENVFQKIVDCFVDSNDKLVNELIISINPKDYLDGKIDLIRMEKYLDYRCEF